RWISLVSLFFQVAALGLVDVIQGGFSTADVLNFSAHFRFYVHLTFAGVGVWLLSEGYSKVRDEIESRLRAARADQAQDMELARNIQMELLPPPRHSGPWAFSGFMRTAMRVGGDYFDHIPAGGYDWFAIGDVTGHGLQAGMLALQARTLLRRALAYAPTAEPRDIVFEVNNAFYEGVSPLRQRNFMTFCLIRCGENGSAVYAGAHLPILILRSGRTDVEVHQTPGPWLGLEPLRSASPIPQAELTLGSGDLMLLFTDGASEAVSPPGRHLGINGLGEIWKNAALVPGSRDALTALNEAVYAEIIAFTEDDELVDDLSLLTIQRS
ncbi:MAG: serine/threonine-protein phosphatase, partial [Spirochaetia bacterium]|nr:serine/threonine-protein phosphatase [Spirochaetia bacterium]